MRPLNRLGDLLAWTTTGLVLATGIMMLLGPGSGLRASVGEWWDERALRRRIAEELANLGQYGALGRHSGAPIVVEFGDYECPYCRAVHPMLERAAADGRIQLYYRHFPLANHPAAEAAAAAAVCAEEQGAFQRMHAYLFETSDWRETRDWSAAARAVGVADMERFEDCIDHPDTAARIRLDMELASRLGVQATPTFVTLNGIHVGAIDEVQLFALIRAE